MEKGLSKDTASVPSELFSLEAEFGCDSYSQGERQKMEVWGPEPSGFLLHQVERVGFWVGYREGQWRASSIKVSSTRQGAVHPSIPRAPLDPYVASFRVR